MPCSVDSLDSRNHRLTEEEEEEVATEEGV